MITVKVIFALVMGFHVALGNLALAGVSFTVPVAQAFAAEPIAPIMTPLSSENIPMSIAMTPALPQLPVTQGAQKEQEEEDVLACADARQSSMQAFGARSACPTDRCITTRDDGTPPTETSFAFRSPSATDPLATPARSVPPEYALRSAENDAGTWNSPPLASLLATVVLRV